MGTVGRILNGLLNWTISIFFITMVILVFFNVVLRYGFSSGITWSEEMGRYLFVWIVFLGAIVAYKDKAHLGVDIVIGALPRGPQKVLYTINNLIVIATLGLFIYGGVQMFEIASNNHGPATGIPLSFLYSAGLISAITMLILAIIQTIEFVVFNKNAPPWAKPLNDEGDDEA
ncbi:TRAP-type C4-dicarboxylate transport system permease small subunit [Geomicrobium halophilum]|uniref:TRAP-type C4-dicarboxylate transport system permease small subunit n=1 Tax=Geomicrobium halophilum TaxID=549000 RepID=A0A841PXE2_9BACL|nr:TRAP transporter small permease [Geomicrobium halophilum]MBB6448645.1 TRAP-type C4-dicarboxylate transport system permease small subunit [Geomicrobium halophilum]